MHALIHLCIVPSIKIQADTSRVIYSWNDNDPANDDPNEGPMYHGGNRGAVSLNLLSGDTNPPVDADPSAVGSFTLGVQNVRSYRPLA